ncbi:MAG: D-alanine--D-alanine ligase [Clostridia bacterium]|nr:D-alanine--D-alanine ligase [Clostridia bacterium]
MKIAVFYGGKSCEHGVSIITGVSVLSTLSADGVEVYAIYIDKGGRWWNVKNYAQISAYSDGTLKKKRASIFAGENCIYIGKKQVKIDCAVICAHGAYGEDGCLQGILQSSFIPYTGSGVLGSAVGMDKAQSKTAFLSSGLAVVDGITVDRYEWENGVIELLQKAKGLGYPLVVKPRSLGSSIGVGVAHDGKELLTALGTAFCWDNGVIIEKMVQNAVEFNCAVLFDGENYITSEVERPMTSDEILTFADKYERGGFKGEGLRQFPAVISAKLKEEIQNNAVKAFKAVGCDGIARVDFLFNGENLFVNEINTIPGSLALYLFPDYAYKTYAGEVAVLYQLIERAIEKNNGAKLLRYEYFSPANFGKNGVKINNRNE